MLLVLAVPLPFARANPDGASGQGNRSVAEDQARYQDMKQKLTKFNQARSALGEEEAAMLLHRWDSWRAAAHWADAKIKLLATTVAEHHAQHVIAAVGNFSPGGKSREFG